MPLATAAEILDARERSIRLSVGCGFSFREIAADVGIKMSPGAFITISPTKRATRRHAGSRRYTIAVAAEIESADMRARKTRPKSGMRCFAAR